MNLKKMILFVFVWTALVLAIGFSAKKMDLIPKAHADGLKSVR